MNDEMRALQVQIDLLSRGLAAVVNATGSDINSVMREAIQAAAADPSTPEGAAAAAWGARWFPKPGWLESLGS